MRLAVLLFFTAVLAVAWLAVTVAGYLPETIHRENEPTETLDCSSEAAYQASAKAMSNALSYDQQLRLHEAVHHLSSPKIIEQLRARQQIQNHEAMQQYHGWTATQLLQRAADDQQLQWKKMDEEHEKERKRAHDFMESRKK